MKKEKRRKRLKEKTYTEQNNKVSSPTKQIKVINFQQKVFVSKALIGKRSLKSGVHANQLAKLSKSSAQAT